MQRRVRRWFALGAWIGTAMLIVAGFAAFQPQVAPPAPGVSGDTSLGSTAGRAAAAAFAVATAPTTSTTAAQTTTTLTGPSEVEVLDAVMATIALTQSTTTTTTTLPPRRPGNDSCGASWYGPGFAGRTTASGEIFQPADMTAAMHGVEFGTIVRVTRLDTGESVNVRINDRGPYVWSQETNDWLRHPTRCIDISEAAMVALDGMSSGVIRVSLSW